MCNERPKTEKEENLDEIIEHASLAKEHLREAGEIARRSNDRDGARELDEEADRVEEKENKFKGIRDKDRG